MKEVNQGLDLILASTFVFATFFAFVAGVISIAPVGAQNNIGQRPEDIFENKNLNHSFEMDENLVVEGNIGPNGNIDGVGNIHVGENVSGIVDIDGRIRIDGNIQLGGEITATDNIEVGKSVSGMVRSENNISIGEDLKEGGSATLETPGKTMEIEGSLNGDAKVTENANVSIGEVPVDTPVDVSVESSPLDGVNISVQNQVANLEIEISNLKGDVETDINSPEGPVYSYQEVKASVPEEEIEEAMLNANMEKSWLEDQGIDSENAKISRYTGGEWVDLPTEVVDENATHVEIEAETPGFSTFSITGEESVGTTDGGTSWALISVIIVVIAIIAGVAVMKM